jgi:hypothetical protein
MQTHRHNSSQDKFLKTISESMHEMAQPLSTIQASLELALLSPTTAREYKEIAENTLAQLRSAVESMQFAARLARFQQPASDVRDVCLRDAMLEAVSNLQRTLDAAQVKLVFRRSECEPSISVSPTRLRQLLFYVLQTVQCYSQPGDLAKIETDETSGAAGHLRMRVQHVPARTGPTVRAISPQDNIIDRALTLAEAIVTSGGGEFSVTTAPLLIMADFPLSQKSASAVIEKNKVSDLSGSHLAMASQRLSKTS